jgi:hypothetical protein
MSLNPIEYLIPTNIDPKIRGIIIPLVSIQVFAFLMLICYLTYLHLKRKKQNLNEKESLDDKASSANDKNNIEKEESNDINEMNDKKNN